MYCGTRKDKCVHSVKCNVKEKNFLKGSQAAVVVKVTGSKKVG